MPQTSLPSFIPQKKIVGHQLGKRLLFVCLPLTDSTRKLLLFGFKNRTFELDFYGLVKHSALVPTRTWSLPLPGLVQLLRSRPQGALRGDLVDLRVQPWPRTSPHGSQPLFSCAPMSHAARGWDVLCLCLPPPQLAESPLSPFPLLPCPARRRISDSSCQSLV